MANSQWKSLLNFATHKHIFLLICSVFFAILSGAVTPIQSYLLGHAFETLTKFVAGTIPKDTLNHDMLVDTLYFVGLGTLSWILTTLFFANWALFGELQARSARERLFKALLDRKMVWFDQRKDGVGAMTTKLQSFIADLQDATGQPLGLIVRDGTTALASLGLALHQSWKLTLVVISTLPLVAVLVPVITRKVQCAINMQIDALSAAAKHVTNTFTSIETVKCCNGQPVEKWRYITLLGNAKKHYIRQVNWNALQIAILRVVALSMFVQGFWYGSTLVDDTDDTGTPGSILTAFWSCISATSALMQIVPTLISLEKGKAAGHRLRLLMGVTMAESSRSRTNQRAASSDIGDIAFRNVQFAYPSCPQQLALRGVDLLFPSGELIFVIGESGSGKSTIGQLLMQFYPPSGGTITLDNTPLDTVDASWLRSKVLLVEQSCVLFNTTLHENIALGSACYSTITREDVKGAAKSVMIHEAIDKMPQGFQTEIGTKGSGLSNGQQQRVALARARIRDPAVLILDEATSALDYVNRIAVIERIRKWRKGRSTIIITHDISQILPNDFVYVMKDGLVVQSGFQKAVESVRGSPFQDIIQTPKKSSSKRGSILSQAIPSASPEDAIVDSDASDTESERKSNLTGQAQQKVDQSLSNSAELYSIQTILSTVWPNLSTWDRFRVPIGIVATIAFAASTPVFAFVFSRLLNTLYDPDDRRENAQKYSLAILGIAFCDAITVFISAANNQCLAQSWVSKLRKKAMSALLKQPREFFDHVENAPSRIAECLDQHAEMAQHIVGRFVVSLLKVMVMVAVAIIWSFVSCWKLTLVLLATMPILLLITRGLSSVSAAMEKSKQEAIENASAVFSETFNNVKTVRTLTLESYFTKKHTTMSHIALREGIKEGIYVSVFFGLSQSIVHYIIALILWFASVILQQDAYELDTILKVLTLLIMSISTATTILASVPELSVSQESASRLLRLLKDPDDPYEDKGKTHIESVGDIILTQVQFCYPSRPNNLVLKDVSLRIPAGTCVAVVGSSGSGKSTIASVLLKLYETKAGQTSTSSHDVTLSTLSLHQTSTTRLRDLVALVSQTTTLIPTTISGNIVYGLRGSDSRNNATNVKSAAISAGIHEFVSSLPHGYDTLIGDGGMGVSGGQAQHIAIARALARQPEVLILDEPTSALDAENANIIRQTVLGLLAESRTPGSKPLTVIIITHDKKMMEIADKIVMLHEGRVVEEGPYEQLVNHNRNFARLLKGEAWNNDVG